MPNELSEFEAEVLNAVLRNRHESIEHLTTFLASDLLHIRQAIERLRDRGFLNVSGKKITPLSPAWRSTSIINKAVESYRHRLETHLEQIRALSKQLQHEPELVSRSRLEPGLSYLDAHVFRGDTAGTDALESTFDSPRRSGASHPGLFGMMPNQNPPAMTPEHQKRMWSRAVNLKGSLRLLLPQAPDALAGAALLGHSDNNVSVRWLHTIPSWMWINTYTGEVALPYEWGEVFPHTLIVVHDPTVVSLALSIFDQCWGLASPTTPDPSEPKWVPILRYMRSGLTLEQAAQFEKITPRTARRYLAQGMEHYEVNGMFALAAAWSADLTRQSARADSI